MVTNAGYQALAGVFAPDAPEGDTAARTTLGRAFGLDITPDLVVDGPLAVARTPASGTAVLASGRTLCVLAGRIHNLAEIAAEMGLEPASPPERVLATAYERKGAALLEELSGSFVLLFWNRDEEHGLVAQDQLGASTLHYCTSGSRLLFASEVVLLLQMLPRRPPPCTEAVVRLLVGARPPVELTAYEGIRRATAGHLLRIADGRWERRRYWEPSYRQPDRRSLAEHGEELWAATRRAVRSRIEADDRVGIVMSGGVDSTVVAAAAADGDPGEGRLRGYSAVFPALPQVDESPRIELLVRHLGLPSVQLEVLPQGALALGLEYLRRWELPFPGPGIMLEHPLVARAAEDGMTILLDGQGGDELFGFSPYLAADRLRRGRILASIRLAGSFPLGLAPVSRQRVAAIWRRYALKGAVPYAAQTLARRFHGPARYAPDLLTAASARIYFESDDPWAWKRRRGPRWWAYKAYLTSGVWDEARVPEYLRHRAAMRGLEARPPLMDVALVERALAIPPELNFDRGLDRPVIRAGLKDRVPDEVRLWREKSNLGPLYHETAMAEIEPIRRLLGAREAEIRAFVDTDALHTLLETPPQIGERGWLKWVSAVTSLVGAECWLRQQADPSFADITLASGTLPPPFARVHRAPRADA